jgi:uncharacterized membrane protein HdeD (DUF308 family)
MTTAELTADQGDELEANEWWIGLLQGIASVVIGILLITDPSATLTTLLIFFGIYLFVSGIFDLVRLFVNRSNWGWRLVSGILGIVAGLAIVRHPLWATLLVPATLVWILGLAGIIMGGINIVLAFRGGGWGTGIVGFISIGLGLWLIGAGPFVSTATLVVVGSIWAIVVGVLIIVNAFRLRAAARSPQESF